MIRYQPIPIKAKIKPFSVMMSFKSTLACLILLLAAGAAYFSQSGSSTSSPAQADMPAHRAAAPHQEISSNHESKTATRITPAALDLSVTSEDPAQQAACTEVEWAAHKRLESLDELLKLTKVQKERIFPILVRGVTGYSPAMKAGGQPIGDASQSTEDAICAQIDPARQAIYQEMLIDDADWWSSAATQLETALEEPADQPISLPSPVQ